MSKIEENNLLNEFHEIFKTINSKSGYFGESLFEIGYLKQNNIEYKRQVKYTKNNKFIIIDFETNNAIYEIKNYLWNSVEQRMKKFHMHL